ncbi:hypothetical protein [Shewanella cyperi]|uniref:Uncharacterized protein n=1 Tax=Shewanella cyperi TaxID=2814292 RepID=A0A974XQ76_9GAMM|nr:hypothetical protein [Shewanella cyperi]QSX31271.1 hypothetical protein JYB88_06470 [Shewanella cyperi]QSX42056.1 hypothetical protein JYB84_06510 [Shewanella cyperi]
MAKLSKIIKKLCKKHARKAVRNKATTLIGKARKHKVKELKQTWMAELLTQGCDSTKAARKYLKQASRISIAANDPAPTILCLTPATSARSFALKPFKASPCSGCAARRGGLCQCALKYARRNKAS